MPTPNVSSQRLMLIQSFKETSWGGSGAATAKWMGVKYGSLTLKPYRKATVFDEVRGNLAAGFNSAILRKGGEFKIGGYVSYEDAIFLGAGFFGSVAPSGSGPFTYSFVGPTTAQPTLMTYTFEFNQASYVAQAIGCVGNKLNIKGNAMEHWEYEYNGFAQDIDTGTSASITSLSDRTIEVALVPTTTVFMDTGASVGSTQYGGVLVDFDLTMDNAARPIYTAGSLTTGNWVVGDKFKADLTLNMLYTGSVKSFLTTNMMTNTICNIQLKSTSGTKSATVNFSGVLADDPELFGQKDGAQVVKVKLGSIYNTTAAQYCNMTVVNSVAAYP